MVLLLASLSLAACGGQERGPATQELKQAKRIFAASAPSEQEWAKARTIDLPHSWSLDEVGVSHSGWYRSELELAEAPTTQWCVYLRRFAQSAEVFVNGTWIGSSGRVEPPLTRNWNRPTLLRIPPGLLRAGTNTVDVHLAIHPTAPAYLFFPLVGPVSELEAPFQLRQLLQVTVPRYAAIAMASIALVLGFIAVRRPELWRFAYFAAGSLAWVFASSELFVADPPVSARVWQMLVMFAAGASMILFVQSAHRGFYRPYPRMEAAMWIVLTVLAFGQGLFEPRGFVYVGFTLWAYVFGIALYLGWLFLRADRPRIARAQALVFLTAICAVIGLHDALLAFGIRIWLPFFLMPTVSILAAFYLAWVVIDYFLIALREAETLNKELEGRVAAKHAELQENFEKLRELEQQRVVSSERERLMREMHDGMGGQLVSALAMAEDGETSPRDIAEVIRSALDDMRLVIDSLDPLIDDVPTLLGMIRGRIEPRLKTHGLRFDWRVTDLPPTPSFGPEHFLQILRIAQEAITNIVKHADASVIRVETEEVTDADGHDGIRVTIGDDGHGLRPQGSSGRGLRNMRARAERLHGAVEISGQEGRGTTVQLWIPIQAAAV